MGKNKFKPKPVQKDPVPEPELVSEFTGETGPDAGRREAEGRTDKARQRERKEKFRSVMDGTVVLDRGMKHYGSLIVFVFVLGLVVITNSYLSEKVARESARIKTELKELQYRQISAKAEWMRLSRQSSVARMLDGTGVTESKVPPFKVLVPEPERKAWWSPKKLGRHPKDEDK